MVDKRTVSSFERYVLGREKNGEKKLEFHGERLTEKSIIFDQTLQRTKIHYWFQMQVDIDNLDKI